MTVYAIYRDGEEKRLLLEEQKDGSLQNKGVPLIDGKAPESIALGPKLLELVKAKKYSEIPAGCFAHVGQNPSGLLVVDYEAKQKAECDQYLTQHPETVERNEIAKLFARGHKINNDWDEEADTGKGFILIAEAEQRLAAWRIKYPDAAREEAAQELEARAGYEDELAIGAMTYDADGWLSSADQQKRRDEFRAKAGALRAKAAEIRRG